MKTNPTTETLFMDFINRAPEGELAEAMRQISAAVDAAIEAGDADKAIELTADLELASSRYGYYAGLLAGLELGKAIAQGAA